MSGSFDVLISDGKKESKFSLNQSYMGVYIPAGYWRSVENFSTNSVAVIAASTPYNPADAVRNIDKVQNLDRGNVIRTADLEETKRGSKTIKSSVFDCDILELDRHHSQRKGDISVVENRKEVPFNVKRIYYLYDVPGGADRGGHAHKELYQLIVAASGSFAVTLDDGNEKRTFTLNRPYQGLLIKPGIWRTLNNFSSGSVCMVLASEKYDETDYIRDYDEFIEYKKKL